MKERHESTAKKHAYLRDFCELVVMKECKFHASLLQLYNEKLTSEYLLRQICDGKYFGAVVCDIRVPETLKEYFAEMPPVFKKYRSVNRRCW